MDIRMKFDKNVKDPFAQLMKLAARIAAQMGTDVRNIRITSLNKDRTPPPQQRLLAGEDAFAEDEDAEFYKTSIQIDARDDQTKEDLES